MHILLVQHNQHEIERTYMSTTLFKKLPASIWMERLIPWIMWQAEQLLTFWVKCLTPFGLCSILLNNRCVVSGGKLHSRMMKSAQIRMLRLTNDRFFSPHLSSLWDYEVCERWFRLQALYIFMLIHPFMSQISASSITLEDQVTGDTSLSRPRPPSAQSSLLSQLQRTEGFLIILKDIIKPKSLKSSPRPHIHVWNTPWRASGRVILANWISNLNLSVFTHSLWPQVRSVIQITCSNSLNISLNCLFTMTDEFYPHSWTT